jgi:hypothetical protein
MKAPAFLARRGPSDIDRPTWLAFREGGVTASEIAKLGGYKTTAGRNKHMRVLAQEKITGNQKFNGNRYTDWGTEREPILEEWANFGFGFTPESRIACAADEPQHLASIDGWKVDDKGDLHLAEIKTTGEPLTRAVLDKKHYIDQIQWQMYVTDAVDAMVLWELREEDDDGKFFAGARGTILIERDDARITQLLEYATAFLLVLLDEKAGNDGSVEDPMLDDIVDRLQQAKADVKELDPKLREMLDLSGMTAAKTAKWNVSYEPADPKPVAAPELFAEKLPEQAAELEAIRAERADYLLAEIEEIEQKRAEYMKDELDVLILNRNLHRLEELQEIESMVEKFTKPGKPGSPVLRITERKDKK